MMLLLDAGNSRLKWGLMHEGQWRAQGVLEYPDLEQLPRLLADHPAPACAWAVNVAGAAREAQLQTLLAAQGIPLHFLRSSRQQCGVTSHYRDPAQLGADRWAALIGARAITQGPALVVCAGTATTIDFLDAQGHFRGGLIIPGIELMRRSLASGTAGLPLAQAAVTDWPHSTDEAIVTGCIAAQVGAVRELWRRSDPAPDSLCLISGGAALQLLPHLDLPAREVPNLVLEGLARVAMESGDIGASDGIR